MKLKCDKFDKTEDIFTNNGTYSPMILGKSRPSVPLLCGKTVS